MTTFLFFGLLCLFTVLSLASAQAPPVRVELYYEALCPGCQEFVTGPLAKVMATPDLVQIISLKMVSYGNTKYNSTTDVYSCQHGPDECTSDVYEQCAIYLTNGGNLENAEKAYPFLQCMELQEGNPQYAESCYTKSMPASPVSWADVSNCASTQSQQMQSLANAATPSDHQYVPWVLVDGKLLQNTELLKTSICQAYTGTKPPSCRGALSENHKSICMNV